jgi:hypothetical protein
MDDEHNPFSLKYDMEIGISSDDIESHSVLNTHSHAIQIKSDVKEFVTKYGLEPHEDVIYRGAILSMYPIGLEKNIELTEDEQMALQNETDHRWNQPFSLYFIAIIGSLAAVVQGMDEVWLVSYFTHNHADSHKWSTIVLHPRV